MKHNPSKRYCNWRLAFQTDYVRYEINIVLFDIVYRDYDVYIHNGYKSQYVQLGILEKYVCDSEMP